MSNDAEKKEENSNTIQITEPKKKSKEFDIFISYQWDHKPLVQSLYKKLTQLKYKVWMDEVELDDSNLFEQLSEGLINSKLFLCCITKKYAESENCIREFNLAIANKKPLTVLMLEKLNMNPDDLKGLCFVITPLTRYNFYKEISNGQDVWSGPTFRAMISNMDKKLVDKTSKLRSDQSLTNSATITEYAKRQWRRRNIKILVISMIALLLILALTIGLAVGLTQKTPIASSTQTSITATETPVEKNLNPYFKLSKSMIHYWPFQNNYIDVIRKAYLYDGSNVTMANDKYGNLFSALKLSNGKLKISSDIFFDGGNFSLLAWVKPNSLSNFSTLMSFASSRGINQLTFYLSGMQQQFGCPFFNLFDQQGQPQLFYSLLQALPLNQWTHLAFVFQYTSAFVYMNGSLAGTGYNKNNKKPANVTRTNNFIGFDDYQNFYNLGPRTDSDIDELKIFNRELNRADIQFEMTNEMYYTLINSTQVSSSEKYNTNYKQTSGLTHYWPLHGSLLNSLSENSLFGTFLTSYTYDRFNDSNAALNLLNGYVYMPSDVYFTGEAFSLLVWIYPIYLDRGTTLMIVGNRNDQPSNDIYFYLANDINLSPGYSLFVGSDNVVNITSNQQLTLNQWQHLAFVYSSPYFYIYLNGRNLIGNFTNATIGPTNVTRTNNIIGINYSFRSNYILNELKIFNCSLSQEKILFEMNNLIFISNINPRYKQPSGLVSYWPFFRNLNDQIKNADLTDDSLNKQLTSDRFNNSNSSVDLTNSILKIPQGIYFNTLQFTLMAWVYPKSLLQGYAPLLSVSNGPGIDELAFYFSGENSQQDGPNFKIYLNDISYSIVDDNQIRVLSTNEWTHLTFAFQYPFMVIYMNGLVVGTQTVSRMFSNTSHSINFVGYDAYRPNVFSNVIIDELKIFNRVLENFDIEFEMTNEQFTFNIPLASTTTPWYLSTALNPNFIQSDGLISYWPFANNFVDVISNLNLFGTLNVSLMSDQFNKSNSALDFSNGLVQLPPNDYFSSDSFSVLVWIYPRHLNTSVTFLSMGNAVAGSSGNDMIFYLSNQFTLTPSFTLSMASKINLNAISNQTLFLNEWQHLSFVKNNSTMLIYLNGSTICDMKINSKVTKASTPKKRFINYLGASSYKDEKKMNAIIDELKFFTKPLSRMEIEFEMKNRMFI